MLFNLDNVAFKENVEALYVDKSGFISFLNEGIIKKQNFVCVVRPRRFGKTMTCDMLKAYYSNACDSKEIFDNLEVANSQSYSKFLNRFDVVHLNMNLYDDSDDNSGKIFLRELKADIKESLIEKLDSGMQEQAKKCRTLGSLVRYIDKNCLNKFVFIIDEWDLVFRVFPDNSDLQKSYIKILTTLFKTNFSTTHVALAYMTGILPIKRYSDQSALNNFREITMLNPLGTGKFIGFTEAEVKKLCSEYDIDFDKAKYWYDGYKLDGLDIYNPFAVISVASDKNFLRTWSGTASVEPIAKMISKNYENLREDLALMLSGEKLYFRIQSDSSNSLFNLKSKESIFTCLIYLGYLGYDSEKQQLYVPNEDVRRDLVSAVQKTQVRNKNDIYKVSKKAFEYLLAEDSKNLASSIAYIHDNYVPVIGYNSEDALRFVVIYSMFYAQSYYDKPLIELHGGKGYLDLCYLPIEGENSKLPAIIFEFKLNKPVSVAMEQIKNKHYSQVVDNRIKDVLLVGISYDSKTKEHQCLIEKQIISQDL